MKTNKKRLSASLLMLMFCSASALGLASPADDPDDPAYVQKTAIPDGVKAKAEAPGLDALAKKRRRKSH